MSYDRFAPYYDPVYQQGVDYAGDVAYLQEAFRRYSRVSVKRVLDLGAGTGSHAILLARAGFEVDALDLSQGLLDRFAEKLAKEPEEVRARVRLHRGDMSRDVPEGAWDAVVCMFGAWCYLLSDEDAGRMLDLVRARLPEGGLFVFEFWSTLGFRAQKGFVELDVGEGRRMIRLTTPGYDLWRDVYRFRFEHLVLRGDELLDRFDEEHALRLRTPAQTMQLVSKHGLEPAALTRGAAKGKTFDAPPVEDFRPMMIARRGPGAA